MMEQRELPAGLGRRHPAFPADAKGMASRASSGKVLNQAAKNDSLAVGRLGRPGPLDQHAAEVRRRRRLRGRQLRRPQLPFRHPRARHGRRSCNGMASAACGPYGATFFVFTDYMRPSIRLAAIMGLPVFYVFTHDSIGVGEDGPTHQPIEHLAALRAIPNLLVIRPGRCQRSGRSVSRGSAADKIGRRR